MLLQRAVPVFWRKSLKHYLLNLIALLLLLLLSACQPQPPACPPVTGTPRYLDLAQLLSITPTLGPSPTPMPVEIGGKLMLADKVVSGPLCNDTWQGTVYVTCAVQVAEWQENPTFLKGCALNIEPGTVVYVAAHNNAAYYQGCSCHTGALPGE